MLRHYEELSTEEIARVAGIKQQRGKASRLSGCSENAQGSGTVGEVELMKHLSEEQLVSHYYGELDDPLEAVKHLEICDACQTRFAALDRDLSFLKEAAIPDRPKDYGQQVWQRLAAKTQSDPSRKYFRAGSCFPSGSWQWRLPCSW